MLALILTALIAQAMPEAPRGDLAGAQTATDASMDPAAQAMIDARPEVAGYRQRLQALGLRLTPDSGFAGDPKVSRRTGCQASLAATQASVALFKAADAPSDQGGGEDQRQALQARARQLQQDAATWEIACLG